MSYHFFPYIYFLALSAGITLSLAFFSMIRFKVSGQVVFSIWMLVCTFWATCNAFELMGNTLSVKLFWANMQYAAYAFFPVLFFVLALQLGGHRLTWMKVLKPYALFLVMLVPCITTVLVWFDTRLGFVRYNFVLIPGSRFSFIKKSYGPWFYVHTIYSYVLYLCGAFILVQGILTSKSFVYKMQQLLLLIGTGILFVSNFLYIIGKSAYTSIDVTPSFFSITGIIVYYGITQFRFLDLVPVAREAIFENMGEGIIVTDKDGRILDVNSRMFKLFDMNVSQLQGYSAQKVFPGLFPDSFEPAPTEVKRGASVLTIHYTDSNDNKLQYERTCTPVLGTKREKMGFIFSVTDITDLYHAQQLLSLQQKELAVQQEQQRVARDLHDNIGQVLSFATVQIQTIQHELEKGNIELVQEYLDKLKQVTGDSYAELRRYIFNLRQVASENDSFKKTVTLFAKQIDISAPVICSVDFPPQLPSFFDSPEVKSHLLSLTKEAVNNSLKHAHAQHITIGLETLPEDAFVYYIKDDGDGISSNLLTQKTCSSGLRIMQERAMLTGGTFNIESAPGAGTKISVTYTTSAVS